MFADRSVSVVMVYDDEKEDDLWLLYHKAKIIDLLVKKYDSVAGFCIRNVGGVYLEGDRVMGWKYTKEARYRKLPYFLKDGEYEIVWEENMEKEIKNMRNIHWTKLAMNIDYVSFKAFPPRKYLDKWEVEYDRSRAPFPLGQLEGPEILIYTPILWPGISRKRFIVLDFSTYERYFYTQDEKLARAVEEFLVDLMRDIVEATEPEYAYFFYDEREPLDLDPLCEGNKEIYWWVYEDKEEVGLLIGEFMAIKKSVFGNLFGAIDEFKSRAECSLGNLVVEDLGDYYLMYCDGPFGVIYYGGGREAEKYRKIFELARRVGEDIIIDKVCGNVDAEIKIRATVVRRVMSKEEGKRRIEEEAKKLGLNIGKMKITEI